MLPRRTCRRCCDELLRVRHRRPRRCCCPPATGWRSTRSSTPSTAGCRRRPPCSAGTAGWTLTAARRAPLRALRGVGRRAPVLGGRRAGLDGGRRGADPRPAARRVRRGRPRSARPGARCTSWPSRRCGSASGCTPRPPSTRPAPTVVSAALELAAAELGEPGLAGRRALVVGAGAMGALAAAHLRRPAPPSSWSPTGPRTGPTGSRRRPGRRRRSPRRCAVRPRRGARRGRPAGGLHRRDRRGGAGAAGRRSCRRPRPDAPLVICDLGLPRDVDPAVGELPGVRLVDLGGLDRHLQSQPVRPGGDSGVPLARELVAAAVAEYLAAQRSADVTPTVTALRRRASDVVDAELLRLSARLPGSRPGGSRRGDPHRPPGGGQAAAHPDRAGEAAGRRARAGTATPRRCASCSGWTRRHRPRSPAPRGTPGGSGADG